MEKTYENILIALKYYIPRKYWNLNNWDKIIKREEQVKKNVFKYKCSFYTLYFNNKLEPINYDRQILMNGKVYYDVDKGTYNRRGYVLLGAIDWDKQSDWGL